MSGGRYPRAANWRSRSVYEKPTSARLILARALGISIDEAGDAFAALIQGGYGIAPRNPTNGMLAAYIEATEPPKHHEGVITAIGKARVRWQAMLEQGTAMAMSLKRVPRECDHTSVPSFPSCDEYGVTASGIAAPSGGGTPKSGPTEGKSPTAESGDAQ